MKAIVLAAGLGTRLAKYTKAQPKGLVKIGQSALIEHNLTALQRAGISHVTVVAGYRHEQLIEALAPFVTADFVEIVVNPDYQQGSGSSLKTAIHTLSEDVLILEGDLLFHEEVIRRICAPKIDNAMAMGRYGNNRVEGKIHTDNGIIQSITWADDSVSAEGEWVGVTRLCASAAKCLQTTLRDASQTWENDAFQYSNYLFPLLELFPFHAVSIEDLPWVEIDNEEDLFYARDNVLPALVSVASNHQHIAMQE